MRSVVIAGLLVAAASVLLVDHVRSQPPGPRGEGRGPRNERREGGGPPGGGHPGDRPPPPPIIQALDVDRDGELSAEEIKNASTNLLKLDTDKDGALSHEETRPAPPAGRDEGPGGRGPRGPGGPGGPRDEEGGPPPRGPGAGRDRGPGGRPPGDRPRGDRPEGDRGPGGPGEDHGPPPRGKPPELGHVVPPFVRDEISLSDDQKKQVAELESDVKEKLTKILTAEQKTHFEELLERGPGGPPPRRPGEGPGRRPEGDGDRPERPRRPDGDKRPETD